MGIWDRLGNVIKSYLNDDDISGTRPRSSTRRRDDPDLDAAFEELDEFLTGKKQSGHTAGDHTAGDTAGGEAKSSSQQKTETQKTRIVPDEIREDFAELGLTPEATAEECKAAYKKLLKIHHPDRHAGHAGNLKKATEKTTRINAAYRRIEKWLSIYNQS